MKKRIGIAVIAIALLLSGCTVPMPMEILEQIARSGNRDSAAESPSPETESRPEEGATKLKEKRDNDKQVLVVHGGESEEDSREGSRTGSAVESGDDESGEADSSYVKGVTTDNGWESEYWNLCFTAPEGVFMLSDEGMEALMGIGEDIVSENYSEKQREYLEMTSLYEMLGTNAEGDANVAVTVEKLMVRGMDTEDYKKAALLHLRMMQDPVYEILEDSGTAEIAGETFAVVNTRVDSGGEYFQDYYFRVSGDRALIITITYAEATSEQAAALLGGFDVCP
ncbi:hypothetical protein [uncultured Acetatifactor sp.]|uniref:hypothetical protein n=1 Tax=uncultured Acetatifactor sp. TaxID=1671927 RepID=UPI00263A01FA|nr:hypothetical protein [uncultured Acetatifactor sp.]